MYQQVEATGSVSCGGFTFRASDEGLLSREGSCGDDCESLDVSTHNIRNITNGTFDGLSS